VQQTPNATPFYMTECDASELLKWSDVPRKKDNFMAGYQRKLDDRHEKITEFFKTDDSNNIIPNAIIVAVASDHVKIKEVDGVSRIEITVNEKTFEESLKYVIKNFKSRLSTAELEAIQAKEEIPNDDMQEDEEVEDSIAPPSYLATITQFLEKAQEDIASISPEMLASIKEYVTGVSLPGLIIDGQHRVFGAKNVNDFSVKLPIILMPGFSHQEQVFHFYVLNNKAKPLTKTDLRSIVSTSLSKGEIGALYDRFKQVGVTAEQTEWTYRMNNEQESPFCRLIDFKLEGSTGVIPENVAYQVVSKFVNLNKKYKLLTNDVAEWNSKDPYGYRVNLFFTLWNAVKEKYPNAWQQAATGVNSQILQKVSLLMLQEYILDTLNGEMPKRLGTGGKSPFCDANDLKTEIGFMLAFLKEDFFLQTWKLKGLDIGSGHADFKNTIIQAIANQSSNLGNMKLFKGNQ